MTTATVQAAVARSAAADLDTRLTLAAIGMDVLLSTAAGPALEDAHAAVRKAASAPRPEPPTFISHPILRRAGDVIRDRGWHRGAYTNASGAVCALGAIRAASAGDDRAEADAVTVLLGRIRDEFGPDHGSVSWWNDSRRDAADVLRLLY